MPRGGARKPVGGRPKKEETVMARIPKSLHEYLSKLGNVRDLIIKACSSEYGYGEKEKEKLKNPFL